MDLPLALPAPILLLLPLLAAALPALLVALRLRRRRRHKPRLTLPEPRAPAQEEPSDEGREEKTRRRRAKRKQQQQHQRKGGDGAAAEGGGDEALPPRRPRFPLESVAGALQRRINARYDDLARASQGGQSLTDTVDQVRDFLNCLIDARNELLQKSETTQRSITLKKAMLSHTRRSSYDQHRLSEQVDKLESNHERLKKDANVYDFLQARLQLSESYKLMVELNDVMEKEAQEQALANEVPEMSFDELLAKEKEDTAFWWRDGKLRSISDSK